MGNVSGVEGFGILTYYYPSSNVVIVDKEAPIGGSGINTLAIYSRQQTTNYWLKKAARALKTNSIMNLYAMGRVNRPS